MSAAVVDTARARALELEQRLDLDILLQKSAAFELVSDDQGSYAATGQYAWFFSLASYATSS